MDFELADVRPTVLSWFIVGLMAVSFIAFSKYVVNQWDLPVTRMFRDVINAV